MNEDDITIQLPEDEELSLQMIDFLNVHGLEVQILSSMADFEKYDALRYQRIIRDCIK